MCLELLKKQIKKQTTEEQMPASPELQQAVTSAKRFRRVHVGIHSDATAARRFPPEEVPGIPRAHTQPIHVGQQSSYYPHRNNLPLGATSDGVGSWRAGGQMLLAPYS